MDEKLSGIVAKLQEQGKDQTYIDGIISAYEQKFSKSTSQSKVEKPKDDSYAPALNNIVAKLKQQNKSPEYIDGIVDAYKKKFPKQDESGGEDIFDFNLDFLKFDSLEDQDGDITTGESVAGSWNNMIDHVSLIDDRALNLVGILTKSTDSDFFKKSEREIKATETGAGQTIGFTDLGDVYEKDGIMGAVGGAAAATFNAITSFASSIAISVPTFGVGLAVDMVSSSVRDYNNEKAEQLGMSLEDLVQSDQAEVVIPVALGSLAYSFERFGIKGVQKALKGMAPTAKKALFNALNAAGKEGGTEFAQGLVESFNIGLAQNDNDISKTGESIADYLKHDALETTLQGAVGGGFIGGVGGLRGKRAARAARTKKAREVVRTTQERIAELDEVLSHPETDPNQKKGIAKVRKSLLKRLNEAVDAPYKDLKGFSDDQLDKVIRYGDKIEAIEKKLEETKDLPGAAQSIAHGELTDQLDDQSKKKDDFISETQKENEKAEQEGTTPAKQKISQVKADTEAERIAPEVTTEEDVDSEQDDPITAAFGPVKSLKDNISEAESISLDDQIGSLEKEIAEAGVPQDKGKLAQLKKLNDQKHFQNKTYNKTHGTSYSLKEMQKPEVQAQIEVDKHVVHLKKVFPGLKLAYDTKEFNAKAKEVNVPANAKGFVHGGEVYLDPKQVTRDTAFHEVSHLWAQSVLINNPKLFVKGAELMLGTETARIVGNIPAYRALDSIKFKEEMLANAIGKRAAELFATKEQQTAWERFMDEFTTWLKKKLNISSKKDFADLTFDYFVDIGAKSVITGDKTATKGKPFTQVYYGDAYSVAEGVTKDDVTRARKQVQYREFKQKGLTPEKGWSKEEKYKKLIEEQANFNYNKKVGRETQTEVIPASPAAKIPIFKTTMADLSKFKKDNARSLAQGYHKATAETTDEQLAIGIARGLQALEPTGTNLAQLISATGRAAYPKKSEDMTLDDFKKSQFTVGADMFKYLVEKGVIGHEYDFQTGSNVIIVTNDAFVDEITESVAKLPPKKEDFRSVFIGEKPPRFEGPVNENGLTLISRHHPEQKMEKKDYPDVYKVQQIASETPFQLDTEQLSYIKELNEAGLLIDANEDVTPAQIKAKKRAINSAIEGASVVGDRTFYEQHNFVHNGRLMSASTDVNHQSAKFVLSMFTFDQKDAIGESGWKWLKILAQDSYGFEGNLLTEREAGAEKNMEKWLEVARNPMQHKEYIMKADEPTLFLRHILELRRAIDSGDPTTYKSGMPNHMDATTSGIQFLAGLAKDQKSALIANLTDTKERSDSYIAVAKAAWSDIPSTPTKSMTESFRKFKQIKEGNRKELEELREDIRNMEEGAERDQAWKEYKKEKEALSKNANAYKDEAAMYFWGQEKIRKKMRKIVKKPVMTKYYSAKKGGISSQILEQWQDHADFKGIDRQLAYWLADRLVDAADEKMPGPAKVMDMLIKLADDKFKKNEFISYHNPVSNFKAVNDPKVSKNWGLKIADPANKGKFLEVSVAFDTQEKDLSAAKRQTAPFVVHSFDAALIHYVFLNADFPVQTIHDSFATNPANSDKLYALVRQGFHDIMKGQPLLDLLTEITGDEASAKEYHDAVFVGDWNPADVKNNEYSFSAGVSDPALSNIDTTQAQVAETATKIEEESSVATTQDKAAQTKQESKPCK